MSPSHPVSRQLILLRHAKSDWSGGEPDLERPLATRGKQQAPEAGAWLAANLPAVDLAVVSPAERARATWDLVSAELTEPPDVRHDDRVYAATERELLDIVQELPDDLHAVVLVGHNPGLEDLLARLTGRWRPMTTSALAVIGISGGWADADSGSHLVAAGRPPKRIPH
jgi:phosphohistidine phosphatase